MGQNGHGHRCTAGGDRREGTGGSSFLDTEVPHGCRQEGGKGGDREDLPSQQDEDGQAQVGQGEHTEPGHPETGPQRSAGELTIQRPVRNAETDDRSQGRDQARVRRQQADYRQDRACKQNRVQAVRTKGVCR